MELLRIGELSKRSGVSPELLRAWERRYRLLEPQRSAGGLRLYSAEDLERVRRMRRHLDAGLAAAEAAALAARPPVPSAALAADEARGALAEAIARFDEPAAQELLDGLLARVTVETLLADVLLPFLRDLGEGWERGEVSVAQEHFASAVIRGRLLGLARGWGRGVGPLAVLACLPGEHHDLGLIAFGLALRARGWRIAYLGTDAPVDTVAEASRALQPRLIVLNALSRERILAALDALRGLARAYRVAVGGAGVPAARAEIEAAGALALPGDPAAEAEAVAG